MIQTYRLTPQDTLPGLLAKLTAACSAEPQAAPGRVLFVVPPQVALNAVALRALRRRAAQEQVALALVTSDPALRMRAAREGISTFRAQQRAESARWRRLRTDPDRLARPTSPSEIEAPPAAGLFARRPPSGFRPVAFLRAFVRRPNPWWASLGLTVFLAALFVGMLYALALIVPAATVRILPAVEPIRVTASLRAVQDAGLDVEAGIVPAQVLSVQVAGNARTQTTGRRAEPTTKARGRVTFINRTSRDILVPTGTVVATATGNNVQFATTADFVLAPNGRAPVLVEAVLPGPSGNVRAGTITRVEGPLSLSLLVANQDNFAGGTTAQVGVVTEEDKVRLQEQLFEELKLQAQERFRQRVASDRLVPPESINYLALSPAFTPFVGEVAEELFLSMSVQAVGLSVDQAAANQAALAQLQAAMPPGTRLIADRIRYTLGTATVEDERTVRLTVTAEGALLRGIDTAAVRRAILGLAPDQAAELLTTEFELAARPEIVLGPDWLPYIVPINLPALPWRIRVVVDWDAAALLAMRQ